MKELFIHDEVYKPLSDSQKETTDNLGNIEPFEL